MTITKTSPPGIPYRRRLVIMVKAPRAGRVKTRLAKDIGLVAATQFYRRTSAAVIQRLSGTGRWQTILAVTPDTAIAERAWPPAVARIEQGEGDLGTRMRHIFKVLPPGPVVIVGTDIPAIRPAHIAQAFARLGDNDAVFGPATDGGYWLVGAARRRPLLAALQNVRWSGPHALQDSINSFKQQRITTTDLLSDVDDGAGYRHVHSWCGRRVLPA